MVTTVNVRKAKVNRSAVQLSASRRQFLGGAGGLLISTAAFGASIQTLFDVSQAPFLADQTGGSDSSAAFQAALDAISKAGKGVLYVPSGLYRLDHPVSCSGASLTIRGDGQYSSILASTHNATVIAVNCSSSAQCVTILDIGMSPIPYAGGAGGTALAINFPATQESGWSNCAIRNVSIGVPLPNYTIYQTGIGLTNVWRGRIEDCNIHSNLSSIPTGSAAISLNQRCTDVCLNNVTADGFDVGVAVNAYAEGLHILNSTLICNTGFSSGNTSYAGNGVNSPLINLLGLYITASEFSCYNCALNLFQVDTAWIAGTHFGGKNVAYPVVQMAGCGNIQMDDCGVTGLFNSGTPQEWVGIRVGGSPGWNSNGNQIDSGNFTNLACAILFGPGTFNCSARNTKMFAPGLGSLIAGPTNLGEITLRPMWDTSGNTTNSSSAVASAPVLFGQTRYTYYNR